MFELRIGTQGKTEVPIDALGYFKTFVEMVSYLAWPLTLLTLAILFRRDIVTLAKRLRKLSAPGVGAEFEENLALSVRSAELAAPGTGAETEWEPDQSIDLAQVSPTAAVFEAYGEIERYLRTLNSDATPLEITSALKSLDLIPVDLYNLFRNIRATRNSAVHQKSPIAVGEALEFQRVVRVFIESIKPLEKTIAANKQRINKQVSVRLARRRSRLSRNSAGSEKT